MWTADNWKDYEVIDTGSGEKLERWGEYLLVRPDPQVIWESDRKHPGWKKRNGHYHRSSRGGGEWEFSGPAAGVEHPLPSAHLPAQALQLQAHRALSGAGGQLGLVFRYHPERGPAAEGAQPFRLYGRRDPERGRGGSQRHPCGRLKGHGDLGQGKRGRLRPGRSAGPLAGGRLRQICGA